MKFNITPSWSLYIGSGISLVLGSLVADSPPEGPFMIIALYMFIGCMVLALVDEV